MRRLLLTTEPDDRTPMRPQDRTVAQERARYPSRLAAWERGRTRAEGNHTPAAIKHLYGPSMVPGGRGACEKIGCRHVAHERTRRDWVKKTERDVYHLRRCEMEEGTCPSRHDSHLLPPEPLTADIEWCCRLHCYKRPNRLIHTGCKSVPKRIRLQREAEERANHGRVNPVDLVKVTRIDRTKDIWGIDGRSMVKDA